jgi:pimeloyl-ACP methyl ester carboxylesterase
MRDESSEGLRLLLEAASLADVEYEEAALPADRELTASGLKVHLLDWGNEGRPPILFLHGGTLTAHTWDLVCLALRADYHCLAYDLRGHGDTGWAADGDYSLEAHRADLEAVVQQLGLERFILVGMSLGGTTSLAYAGKRPETLSRLVLVDTGPETHAVGRRRITDFVTGPRELDSLDAFVERAIAFNPSRHPALLRRSLLYSLRQTPRGTWTWKQDPAVQRAQTEADRAHRQELLRAAVPRVTCPTLVVRGGNSEVLHDEDAARLARALPRGAWVRIEGAGHTVQGDQPRAFVEALRRFLAETA